MIKLQSELNHCLIYIKNAFRINEIKNNFLHLKRNNLFKFMEKNQHSQLLTNSEKNIFLYDINSFQIQETIALNQKELDIFSLINNVLQKNDKNTICRVAGGWLIGRENYDIDIALDDMMGEELAKMINDEIYPGNQKFGVVNKNCEKSKHLETASMFIFGMPIDFVNLRSETYTDDSRVPQIEIGTPGQDASRRDITINALFYNIKSNKVEDFLGNGITDLKNSLIRTPIDPIITFNDDPLRILRVIRFAVRFQFHIDNLIECAARNQEIKESLYKKISNERIAKEMLLMLEGNIPQCSIYLLYKYNIIDACLKIPMEIEALSDTKLINEEIDNSMKLVKIGAFLLEENLIKDYLIFTKENQNLKEKDDRKLEILKDFRRSIYLALLTFTFKKYEKKMTKKELVNGAKLIYKESLKLSNDLLKEITIFSTSVEDIITFINNQDNIESNLARLDNAKLIRKIKNPFLLKSIFLAMCFENLTFINNIQNPNKDQKINFDKNFIEKFLLNPNESMNEEAFRVENELFRENYKKIIKKYSNWLKYLDDEDLFEIDNLKPIFDGSAIQKILNIKAGKSLGILMESLIEFQILKRSLTEEEGTNFLKNKFKELQA